MHAFLRFRHVRGDDGERFVAWFEPEHFILEATAPFFVDRFRSLDWSILTPIGSLRWDRETLRLRPAGAARGRAGGRRLRGGLARLLRERVQPGPGEPDGHAGRDAEEVLAQHAGGRLDPGLDPDRAPAR